MRAGYRCWKSLIVALAYIGVIAARPAFAASPALNVGVEQQLVTSVNSDRLGSGLSPLQSDPRLTTVAEERAQSIVASGNFSHCAGANDDSRCSSSGFDFLSKEKSLGLDVVALGDAAAENLAINNFGGASSAASTNAAWMGSPEHRANILDPAMAYTGVGVACCFVGMMGGQVVSAADGVLVYVQEFLGGRNAPTLVAGPNVPTCHFVLGFASLAATLPRQVGACAGNQAFSATGDATQKTTGGLLVWRKADNWTAFTDGFHSWIAGPHGVQERLNTQRFIWEANPTHLPIAPS